MRVGLSAAPQCCQSNQKVWREDGIPLDVQDGGIPLDVQDSSVPLDIQVPTHRARDMQPASCGTGLV